MARVAVFFSVAGAQDKTLEERVRALEQGAAASAAPGGETAKASAPGIDVVFDKGLQFRSQGGEFTGNIGAYAITHYTWHGQLNESDGKNDSFRLFEAAIEVNARLWKTWMLHLTGRFAPASDIKFGWVEFNRWDELKIRAGLFKEPVSTETYLDGAKYQDFPEASLLSMLAPARDLGAMVHGVLFKGILGYAVGVFNGNRVGGDENSDKDLAARLQFAPAAASDVEALKGLWFVVSGTHGNARRASNVMPFTVSTPASGTAFHFDRAGGMAFRFEEELSRLGAEVIWSWGPLDVKAEYLYYSARVEFDRTWERTFRAQAWYGTIGFWIGGSRKPGKRPEVDKALFDGGFGAIQFIGRFSQIRFNDVMEEKALFGGSRSAYEFTAGVNWYPNAHVRISAAFTQYEYDRQDSREIRFGTHARHSNDENVVILRAQVDF